LIILFSTVQNKKQQE